MARAVVDLDQSATILDVSERIAAVDPEQDVVLVAAAGAPWLRNRVFIEVARTLAEPRRFALVTSDQRARSLAASVHVPAYSSVTALDRHELDATERLVRRRAAAAPGRASRLRPPAITLRGLGVAASLLAAVLLVLAVVVPEAVVTVAPTTAALAPVQLQLRAAPGEIERTVLSETLSAKVQGAATGSRDELIKAKGEVELGNKQTRSIRIPAGTQFRTSDNIVFVSTEEKTLPSSFIFPPITLTVGRVMVPVEAAVAGRGGNVSAGRITVSPVPNDYTVTNPQPTSGGDVKKIPIVQRQDYLAATSNARVGPAIRDRAEARLAEWRSRPPAGTYVVPRVYTSAPTSVTPESAVVGKEVEIFELTVSFVATAFAVPTNEPRKTAVERLRATEAPGYTLADSSVQYEETLLPDDTNSGVLTWAVTVSGSQIARVDSDRIRRALAGRGLGEAGAVLEGLGVQLQGDVRREPAWWPRLPLLDSRIRVEQVPAGQ
ncbi:MAG TPA: baseplate J/gp47 family protein [Candidatus Limnocylindria bacterium]|nr:baseplate J/gp47 family protein [Candidatus Limnocylindria bacterium]